MTLLAILTAAAVGLGVSLALRLPAVPLLILAGVGLRLADEVMLGLGVDFGAVADADMVEEALVLGLTFLVFAAGMELNPLRVGRQRKPAAYIGLVQFTTMLLVGMAAAVAMGMTTMAALHLGLAVSASSTIVVVRILRNRRQFFEPFGRLVLGVLLLQDLLIILFIAGLSGVEDGLSGIVLSTMATLGLVLLTWVVVKWIAPWLIITQELDQESLLLAALAILFTFTGLAYWMGMDLVIGSFFAGVALSSFPVNGVVRGQLISLGHFFLAVFFVSLGAILVLPTLEELAIVLVMAGLILVVTPVIVVLVAERFGISARASIESGLLLAQSSEFSIIVALLGVGAGHLEAEMLSAIALFTVLTMIMASFIATDTVTWRLLRWHPSRRRGYEDRTRRNHLIMLGCGANSRVLLDLLLLHGLPVLVVDEDPGVVEQLRKRGVDAVRGDAADPRVLEAVNANEAEVIISTIRRAEDNERLLSIVRGVTVLVRVFSDDEAKQIERLGGVAVREADAAARDFLRWFDEQIGAGLKEADRVPRPVEGQGGPERPEQA